MAELESVMEDNLIKQLTTGISQWTYRKDITTEDALWENFRQKLNQNNLAVLDGVKMTDEEFEQIKRFMLEQAQTPYKAAIWLAGENGDAVIPLVREDASKGTVHLLAVSSREIAGGHSSYEVINQYVSAKEAVDDRERRFDVTLLINGMPMIQIELKNQNHPYMDAFRQIKKYKVQGKYKGLFGLVQMYVVTIGSKTRYMAADTGDTMNENFLTSWVNADNQPVENYLQFAAAVLRVPEAHQMIGSYSVLDAERKKLILLRPYQVHAIEAVKHKSAEGVSGFVWHTTGSGKTMTSYTVTKNLLTIPSIDKTIFLIDRKDLDQQTTSSFKAYAENDTVDVEDTQNIGALIKKLESSDRQAIITTIQKLHIVIKRCTSEKNLNSRRTQRLKKLRIGFVVDECHRTVTPETQRILKDFFSNSLWYGFTGTPIFKENKRARKGDLPRTTEGMFGPCLHKYTIKEALNNKAVLGFQIEYKDSIDYEQVCTIGEKLEIGNSNTLLLREDKPDVEYTVFSEYQKRNQQDPYDSDEHRREVVEFIVNKCAGKFRLNAPLGEANEAILTVRSIEDAQKYYRMIKQYVAEGNISQAIRSKVSDFPRIAITFSVTENDVGSINQQAFMTDALHDYNQAFGTSYELDSLRAYNTDLNDRLARKKGRYQLRENQLDIVIVVERLLTGFDAPPCAILFVDKPPMSPQNIIQAFSRTNRLYDKGKKYGMVVIFQRSEEYKRAVDDALWLYSNGGTNDVSAPPFKQIEGEFIAAIAGIRHVAPTPAAVDDLRDRSSLIKFAKSFQQLDKSFGEIQVYMEWPDKDLERDYHITMEEFNDYLGKYQNVLELLKQGAEGGEGGSGTGEVGEEPDIDIEYELETIRSETVDYRYLMALIQKHIPDEDQVICDEIKDENIEKYIAQMEATNPALAAIIRQFWEDMKAHPEKYKGMDAMAVIESRIDEIISSQVDKLVAEWKLKKNEVLFVLETYKKSAPINVTSDFEAYKKNHAISKLQYKRSIKAAIVKLAEKILPLRNK